MKKFSSFEEWLYDKEVNAGIMASNAALKPATIANGDAKIKIPRGHWHERKPFPNLPPQPSSICE